MNKMMMGSDENIGIVKEIVIKNKKNKKELSSFVETILQVILIISSSIFLLTGFFGIAFSLATENTGLQIGYGLLVFSGLGTITSLAFLSRRT